MKNFLLHNFINIPGWRTSRKIVVIESDDWGSIRMPSTEVYSRFLSAGLDLSASDYNRLDTIESNDDLSSLFEVLTSVKDSKGEHPAFTANFVVGNPDFQRIKEANFEKYYFEPVTKTLERYPGRDQVESLWAEGISKRIFLPQFHGREHVNTVRWMNALREGSHAIMFTFDNETTFSGNGDYNFMEVLDYNSPKDLAVMVESLTEGLDLFEDLFGFRSVSFIPPCYTWSSVVEEALYHGGVRYIQGLVIQQIPTGRFGHYKKKYHFMGSRNVFGQYYLIRNCFFEPSLTGYTNEIDRCLARIKIAFRWNKPAVICSHRINYIGALQKENRDISLSLLKSLLKKIIRHWPDVEFMTTDRLGDMIAANMGEKKSPYC